jgi:hypothetical protein
MLLETQGEPQKGPYVIAMKEETMKNGSGAQRRSEVR